MCRDASHLGKYCNCYTTYCSTSQILQLIHLFALISAQNILKCFSLFQLIKNVHKQDEALVRIPAFERAVSRVLRDIKVVRRYVY